MYAGSILGNENRSYRIFNRESLSLEAVIGEMGREICPVLSRGIVSELWSKSQLLRSECQKPAGFRSTNPM